MTRERIEDFREIVLPFVKKRLLETNYENLGKSDAEMFAKDFDEILNLAIKALEQEPVIVPMAEIKFDEDKLKELVNKAVLTVTPQGPKTGHWYIDERPESDREVICSNCEQSVFKYHKLDFDYRPKYCPNCGAKMVEPHESEDKE